MAAIQDVARQFFEACEAGKGWATCQAYCKPDASFSCQAEPLVDVKTLQGYADWMQGLMMSRSPAPLPASPRRAPW